jgi:hypothetical protein
VICDATLFQFSGRNLTERKVGLYTELRVVMAEFATPGKRQPSSESALIDLFSTEISLIP